VTGPPTPLLLVGPVTMDHIAGKRLPGGGVAYGARVAAAFGIRARILTIAAPDADLSALEGHDVHVVDDAHTVTFMFEPSAAGRVMRVPEQPSRPLAASDLPAAWADSKTLMVAPLIEGDVDLDSFTSISRTASRVGVIAQGLQRHLIRDHFVDITPPRDSSFVRSCSTAFTFFRSQREAALWTEDQRASALARGARLVTTRGQLGATIETAEGRLEVPAFPVAHEVDTTGAGDVFATALILALDEGDEAATELAAAFAAASVEQIGPASLPTLSEIRRRLVAERGNDGEHADESRRGARA